MRQTGRRTQHFLRFGDLFVFIGVMEDEVGEVGANKYYGGITKIRKANVR